MGGVCGSGILGDQRVTGQIVRRGRIVPVVCVDKVTREYATAPSLRDLTFEIGAGELVALIGPGDAGKTNLMRLLMGLSQPDSGEIEVFGDSPGSQQTLERTGVVLEQPDFPATLRICEVIDLVRAHYDDPAHVADLADRCGFHDSLERPISELSSAELRWLAILLAFAGNPAGVFMDMPTEGMDVQWRRRFWNLLRDFTDQGGMAFVSSSALHEVEVFASRVIVLLGGRIVADGSVEQVIANHGSRSVSMRAETLPDVDGIGDVEWRDGGPVIYPTDSDAVVRELTKQEVSFEDLEVRRPSLEEVLLSLIEAQG